MSAIDKQFAAMSLVSPIMTSERTHDCFPLTSQLPTILSGQKAVEALICDYIVPTREAVTKIARIVFTEGIEGLGLDERIQEYQPYLSSMLLDFRDREITVRVPENIETNSAHELVGGKIAEIFEVLYGVTLLVAPTLILLRGNMQYEIEVNVVKAGANQAVQELDADPADELSQQLLHNRLANFQKRVTVASQAKTPQIPLSTIIVQSEEPDS